jgi:hypothetical protein
MNLLHCAPLSGPLVALVLAFGCDDGKSTPSDRCVDVVSDATCGFEGTVCDWPAGSNWWYCTCDDGQWLCLGDGIDGSLPDGGDTSAPDTDEPDSEDATEGTVEVVILHTADEHGFIEVSTGYPVGETSPHTLDSALVTEVASWSCGGGQPFGTTSRGLAARSWPMDRRPVKPAPLRRVERCQRPGLRSPPFE